jgi:hypothetical protein
MAMITIEMLEFMGRVGWEMWMFKHLKFYRHKVQGLKWVVRVENTNVWKLKVPPVFAQWNLMTSPGLS